MQSLFKKLSTCGALVLTALVFTLFAQGASAQEYGIEAKRPVFGGACITCPWGAAGIVVEKAMEPYGYDVELCLTCSRVDSVRIVSNRRIGPSLEERGISPERAYQFRPTPDAPVDFGAVAGSFLWEAYHGTGRYANDEQPYTNVRLIANIQYPLTFLVAVRSELGITDLSQIRDAKWPLTIGTGLGPAAVATILDHYGLSPEEVEAAGGSVLDIGVEGEARYEFDMIIGRADPSTAPEFENWYDQFLNMDLTLIELPEDLLQQVAETDGWDLITVPVGYLPGVTQEYHTFGYSGIAIYGRDDMPEQFAYDVAKALDEQQHLLQWNTLNLSYNYRTVAEMYDIPLHPGAERYYREVGFID